MTNPSLYRDDSRVRHMLDAMERISELSRGLERDQLRRHENTGGEKSCLAKKKMTCSTSAR